MTRFFSIGFFCIAALLSACTYAGMPQKQDIDVVMAANSGRAIVLGGGRRVPGPELEERLSGNILQDVYGTFTWRFHTDGTYDWGGNGGADGTWYSTGTWSVKDDAFCWTLDGYDMGCRAVFIWNGILRIADNENGLEAWGIY